MITKVDNCKCSVQSDDNQSVYTVTKEICAAVPIASFKIPSASMSTLMNMPPLSIRQQNTSNSAPCSKCFYPPSQSTIVSATVFFSGVNYRIYQLYRWPPLAPRHVRSPTPTSLTRLHATHSVRPETSSPHVGSMQALSAEWQMRSHAAYNRRIQNRCLTQL